MLNRDFTKTNKDYFNKNKIVLIILALFFIVGIVIGSVFGMKGNFEFSGYNEFSVKIGSTVNVSDYSKNIEKISKLNGANVDTIIISGQGDNTKIIVRYTNTLSDANKEAINTALIEKIDVNIEVGEHVHVAPVVSTTDYVFTIAVILLLVVIASIFAYFRHNGASAISLLLSCVLGTLGFLSIGAILRLSIGMSYFAMLVILNMLIVYLDLNIFEEIRTTSWLENSDYSEAIKSGMKSSRFKLCFVSVALMAIGLLFVLIAPNAVKYVSLNVLFMAVALLATTLYVTPFVWNVCITHCRKRTIAKKK